MDKNRFRNMTSFLDLLWILLAGFGAMFIIAFLLIQPPAKNADIIKKAEYMIVLEWDKMSADDIDLWVQNPWGGIVSFRGKTMGYMNLEKDDLGAKNDTYVDQYGVRHIVRINREVVTLRGVREGEYSVMVHVYNRYPVVDDEEWFTIEVIKINPYRQVFHTTGKYYGRGQEVSVVRFEVNAVGDFLGFNTLDDNFIQAKMSNADRAERAEEARANTFNALYNIGPAGARAVQQAWVEQDNDMHNESHETEAHEEDE